MKRGDSKIHTRQDTPENKVLREQRSKRYEVWKNHSVRPYSLGVRPARLRRHASRCVERTVTMSSVTYTIFLRVSNPCVHRLCRPQMPQCRSPELYHFDLFLFSMLFSGSVALKYFDVGVLFVLQHDQVRLFCRSRSPGFTLKIVLTTRHR